MNARFVTTATRDADLVAVAPRCVARASLPQPETATRERTAAAIRLDTPLLLAQQLPER